MNRFKALLAGLMFVPTGIVVSLFVPLIFFIWPSFADEFIKELNKPKK